MEALLTYLLKSGGVLCLFYMAHHFLLKKETLFTFNRYFLLAGLVASMILPVLYVTKTVMLQLMPQTLSTNNLDPDPVMGTSDVLWPSLLLTIYILGVLFFSSKLTKEFQHLIRLIKKGTLHKHGTFSYVQTKLTVTPFSFFSYIVYNPDLHTQKELEAILEHEKIHSRQKHSLDIVLMELCLVFQWFNPIAWLYRKSLKENLEYLADTNIHASSFDKKEYQYILLKQAIGPKHLSIVNPFFNSLIKKRIVMMNQHPSHKLKALKSLLIVPFLALFLVSFNTKTQYVLQNNPISQSAEGTIELIIDKSTTDEELLKIKNDLKQDNIDFSYTTVRNGDGEISSLSLHVAGSNKGSEFSSSHNSTSDNDTIDPTYILIDTENNSISIGNGHPNILHSVDHANVWIHTSDNDEKHQEIIIKKSNGKKQVIINGKEVSEEELEDMDIDVDEDSFIMIDSDDENITKENIVIRNVSPVSKKHVMVKSKTEGDHDVEIMEFKSDGFFYIDTDGDKNPMYLIDGKVSTEKQVKKLDPSNIKSINVLKGSEAIKKHGKKATDGVIEITTNS